MKRYAWVFLAVAATSSTAWGYIMTTASAGGIGMVGGQTVGRVLLPGMYGGDIGLHVSVLDLATSAIGTVICGSNTSNGNSNPCSGNDQPNPPCSTGCWPNWPNWCLPWGNVTTSSNSTSTTTANGPDCTATAETSGLSVGPGCSSSSHSYAQSVNP
jgi:hypothetical protein